MELLYGGKMVLGMAFCLAFYYYYFCWFFFGGGGNVGVGLRKGGGKRSVGCVEYRWT